MYLEKKDTGLYNFFPVVTQHKSNLFNLIVDFLDQAILDTHSHTHVRTHAR